VRDTFLPFCRPDISEAEIAAVAEVLRSGWITTGPRAAELERAFRDRLGVPEAVAVSSATAGMHVLIEALGLGPGDEVITPAMTWVSTVNLIVLAGATPVFVDVDRDHLMTSAERVAERITDRTRLIVPVHFAGAALDLAPLYRLAAERGIAMVEDAAHAVATRYQGELVGRRGTCVFSFHAIKNLTTAEGGLVTTGDPELAERVRRLKFHGLGVDAFDRETQGRSAQAEVLEPGYKYNLPDLAAAIGLGQLARIDEIQRRRRELAERYLERLAEVPEVVPLSVPPWVTEHGWHLLVIRVDDRRTAVTRDELMAGLKARNVGTGVHFRAVHLQKYYRERFGFRPGLLPETEWSSERMCSLPLFPAMTPEDVDSVVEALEEVLAS
jgi:UDP-4-amino-4-deoxy-L-arabinose-oxoglutarate aminotransferase